MPIDNTDVVFEALPMIGAITQIFNMWLYAIVCPLKFRPLVCHVSASNASTGAPSTGAPKFGVLHVKVSTRVFLRASAISMFLVGGMCYVANKWVLGDEAIASLGFREHLHTTPGVVIVAVGTQVCQASRPGSGHWRLEAPSHFRAVLLGLEQSMGRLCPAVHAWSLSAEWGRFHCVRASTGWIVCAALFGLHVLVVCFYESMLNPNSISVVGIEIAGAITFFSAFLMHADTTIRWLERTLTL